MFTKEEIKKIAVIALLVLSGIVVYHILNNFSASLSFIGYLFGILSPIIIGFALAYIINIPMKGIENHGLKKLKVSAGIKRAMALVLTLCLTVAFFTLFFSIAIPQLVDSVSQLITRIPTYIETLGVFLQNQTTQLNITQDQVDQVLVIWQNFIDSVSTSILSVANQAALFLTNFISGIFNAIISVVLAIYMLISKEKLIKTFKKILFAFTSSRVSKGVLKYVAIIDTSFENFIRGQLVEATILGTICFIGMKLFGFEYALLISFLVGMTNIIPLFGPYIGAIPSFLLLFMVNPSHALWFMLYLVILQQFESNVIYPRVVGTSMGISGFWIILAVVVGNSLFGILGILLGIPLLSSFYVIMKEIAEKKLKAKKIRLE